MELTAQEGKGDGEKNQRLRSNLAETGRDPSSPIAVMYWSQMCCYPATLKTCASRLVLCYVKVAGSAVPSTLHEYKSLRWKAREIEVALQYSHTTPTPQT